MNILDGFGKKVAGAGQKTVQKTKDLSDVARLSSLIVQEEGKTGKLYQQIGKLYVSIHQNDYENEFADLVGSLTEIEQKIQEYRQQIQDLKGIQCCEKCGAEVSRGAAFCSSCGAPMPAGQSQVNGESGIICSGCGKPVKKGVRFCTSCGTPVPQKTEPSAPEKTLDPYPSLKPDVVTSEPVQPEKICPNCGTRLEADSVFCIECGAKV